MHVLIHVSEFQMISVCIFFFFEDLGLLLLLGRFEGTWLTG